MRRTSFRDELPIEGEKVEPLRFTHFEERRSMRKTAAIGDLLSRSSRRRTIRRQSRLIFSRLRSSLSRTRRGL